MRILIVEDDAALGLFLQKGLSLEGHQTHRLEDGQAALDHLQTEQPDLIVLDLSLPRRDGLEVLEEVQRGHSGTAVIVLTGRQNLEERLRCFELGAEDCLLKPFSFYELIARCKVVLRRRIHLGTVLRFGSILMDLVQRKITVAGSEIELTNTEFALLESLIRRQGACSSRQELLREVWNIECCSSTNVVDVYMNYLRRKLRSRTQSELIAVTAIETVRGFGYRLTVAAAETQQSHRETQQILSMKGA